jgi:hypothetical protein
MTTGNYIEAVIQGRSFYQEEVKVTKWAFAGGASV